LANCTARSCILDADTSDTEHYTILCESGKRVRPFTQNKDGTQTFLKIITDPKILLERQKERERINQIVLDIWKKNPAAGSYTGCA
jgi:hypothetical protein